MFVPRFPLHLGSDMNVSDTARKSDVDGIPIFVEGWEIECCGPSPVVGDRTAWALGFVVDSSERGIVLPRDARWCSVSGVLSFGGVKAYWRNPECVSPENVRGHFVGTRHSGGVLPVDVEFTTGVVMDMWLEIDHVRGVGQRSEPGSVTRLLRRIERCPNTFAWDPDELGRTETGVLLDVAVPRGRSL